MIKSICRSAHLGAALSIVVTLGVAGCGGTGAPPQAPSSVDPPLEDEPSGSSSTAAPASNAKVKEGMDAIQAQDFAKAKSILEDAVKESPKDPQAAFYLGVAIEGTGDGKAAAVQYRRALTLDPKLTEASTNLSGVLLDTDDAEGALAAADAGLKVAPKSPSLLRNRAVALDATGSKDAVTAFKAAVAASPDDKEIHYLYAEALARGGDQKGAIAEATGLVDSDDVGVLASTGRLLGKLQAFDRCIAALDKAVAKKNAAELIVERGLCKHGKKDDQGASADFAAAIAVDPKFAPAHYYLGQQKRAEGNKKAAKAELQKVVELDGKGKLAEAAKKAIAELK